MLNRPSHTNRLIHEKSPYLLQHAHNPVDWYPWGDEAFLAAKEQDKPIFLSIGYATCHWCHTMETESFEDEQVAGLMNEAFISIKVDREELPEVDSLYMEFAQSMMTGSAGWPLNILITPTLKPFFATTYLPPREREGMMGMVELVQRIREVWNGPDRDKILTQAERIVEVFRDSIHTSGEVMPESDFVNATIELLYQMADPVYGGIKGAPKFPIAYQADLLMAHSALEHDSRALFIVEKTLDMMHRGGIFDHVGGGFSRYAVDEEWLIPHFEKMLYDNALLIHAYIQAFRLTKREFYQTVSEETIQYILRDMTHPEGGFFSAQDADSDGVEGLYYTWTLQEVKEVLKSHYSEWLVEYFGITEEGNFEGRNVLHTPKTIEEFSEEKNLDHAAFEKEVAYAKHALWMARRQRVPPQKDDKILSSWNGLMIHALAEAGAALRAAPYKESAIKAATFLNRNLWLDGQLLRRWRDGDAHYNAGLDEYAFLIRGLLSLFETDCGTHWLQWALEMADILFTQFKAENGGFYQTDGSDPNLILRKCQFSDGAEPSGNAIHCENLLRLYGMTNEKGYLEQAEDTLRAVEEYLDTYSPGYCYHIYNLMRYTYRRTPTVVVALNREEQQRGEIHQLLFGNYIPFKNVIWRRDSDKLLFRLLPWVERQPPLEGRTTLYICREGVCDLPLTDPQKIRTALENL